MQRCANMKKLKKPHSSAIHDVFSARLGARLASNEQNILKIDTRPVAESYRRAYR